MRYPAGWRFPAGQRGADEEFLVLDGALTAGGTEYGHLSYAHWPAGFAAGSRASKNGATVLTFFSADPRRPPPGDCNAARLVERLDAYATPYTGNFHPEFPPSAGRKVLFTDPVTQETSWLLGTMPLRSAARSEVHDTVEEMYLLPAKAMAIAKSCAPERISGGRRWSRTAPMAR